MGTVICFRCHLRRTATEGLNIPLCKCIACPPRVVEETHPCGCVYHHRTDMATICSSHLRQMLTTTGPSTS